MLITPAQLRKVCQTLSNERAIVVAGLLSELYPKYGMDTADEFCEFLAQLAVESGEFNYKEENLRYSARRILQVWPSRFKNLADAEYYADNAVRLANKVYANRLGNGPEVSGDGFRYRGGGWLMLTGRDTYMAFAKYMKVDVVSAARHVHTEDRWALESALWWFCVYRKLLPKTQGDAIETISQIVNGGTIGMTSRKMYYGRAVAALS